MQNVCGLVIDDSEDDLCCPKLKDRDDTGDVGDDGDSGDGVLGRVMIHPISGILPFGLVLIWEGGGEGGRKKGRELRF